MLTGGDVFPFATKLVLWAMIVNIAASFVVGVALLIEFTWNCTLTNVRTALCVLLRYRFIWICWSLVGTLNCVFLCALVCAERVA